MARLQVQPLSTPKKNSTLRTSLRIDMTPMVDLGFLLITFFIFTTTMAENKATRLIMPKDGPVTPVPNSTVLTALLASDNRIFVYEGMWKDALAEESIKQTDYHLQEGLGKWIRTKQQTLGSKKPDLLMLIKPGKESTYGNLTATLLMPSMK